VIGSNSGAIPDVVGDGGLIFAEGDSKQLAHCVCTMYADEANRRAMGERGRVSVAEKYTWEKVAARMHDIYIRVASTKGVVKSLDS
jgi:glycosyltransferase involved in cell wall biosynthesis